MQAVDQAGRVFADIFGIGLCVADQLETNGVFPILDILIDVDQKWVGIFRPAILLPEADKIGRAHV